MTEDDDKYAIGPLGRQEILTGLIVVILAMIPVSAGVTLWIAYSNPNTDINLSADIDATKFVDKTVESYDAFLVLLGVGVGGGVVATALKKKGG